MEDNLLQPTAKEIRALAIDAEKRGDGAKVINTLWNQYYDALQAESRKRREEGK